MILRATLKDPIALGMAVTMEVFEIGTRETDALITGMRAEGNWLVLQLKEGCRYLTDRKMKRGSLRIPLTQVAHVLEDDEVKK